MMKMKIKKNNRSHINMREKSMRKKHVFKSKNFILKRDHSKNVINKKLVSYSDPPSLAKIGVSVIWIDTRNSRIVKLKFTSVFPRNLL